VTETSQADPAAEKAARASSFGGVAEQYEAFRPGPPGEALDWILGGRVDTAVDLGAGTGGCTRVLLPRADTVFAIEPDDRMRAVLSAQVPGATAHKGTGESMPLPDASADAVVASASWHWMDPIPALTEIGRVLRPGGVFGAVWAGPDPEGPFMSQARALLEQTPSGGDGGGSLADAVTGGANLPDARLEIPDDGSVPFDQPEFETFRWDIALTADDLIGLLGTMSWVILMEEPARISLFNTARRLLADALGIKDEVTVDVAYQADTYRARRHA